MRRTGTEELCIPTRVLATGSREGERYVLSERLPVAREFVHGATLGRLQPYGRIGERIVEH